MNRCAPRAPRLFAGGFLWQADDNPVFSKQVKSSADSMDIVVPLSSCDGGFVPQGAFVIEDEPPRLTSISFTVCCDTAGTAGGLRCSTYHVAALSRYIPFSFPHVTHLSYTFHPRTRCVPRTMWTTLVTAWSLLSLTDLSIWNFCFDLEGKEGDVPAVFSSLRTLKVWGRDDETMRAVIEEWHLPALNALIINVERTAL